MSDMKDERSEERVRPTLLSKDGKPPRILSTSLGLALLANAALVPGVSGASAADGAGEGDGPKLVEWSTEAVKAYYDPAVDWNLPLAPGDDKSDEAAEQPNAGDSGGAAGGATTVIHHGGFGWEELMLYHLLFNRGSAYSSSSWSARTPVYYRGTADRYKAKTHQAGTFQNKPVVGSTVRPKTANTTGSVTRRSTSSAPGGIGGKSSGYSSSGGSVTRSSSGGSSSSAVRSGSSGFGG